MVGNCDKGEALSRPQASNLSSDLPVSSALNVVILFNRLLDFNDEH
jgi:hypothetical protein